MKNKNINSYFIKNQFLNHIRRNFEEKIPEDILKMEEVEELEKKKNRNLDENEKMIKYYCHNSYYDKLVYLLNNENIELRKTSFYPIFLSQVNKKNHLKNSNPHIYYEMMKKKFKIKPDSTIYNLLILNYINHNKLIKIKKVYKEIKERKKHINSILLFTFLNTFLHCFDIVFLKEIINDNIKKVPEVVHNKILREYFRRNQYEDAYEYYKYMVENKFPLFKNNFKKFGEYFEKNNKIEMVDEMKKYYFNLN
jgi:pentatricopeptide repeat protein